MRRIQPSPSLVSSLQIDRRCLAFAAAASLAGQAFAQAAAPAQVEEAQIEEAEEVDPGALANELVVNADAPAQELGEEAAEEKLSQLEKIRQIASQNSVMPPKPIGSGVDLGFLELGVDQRPAVSELKTDQIRAELERLRIEDELRKARLEARMAQEKLESAQANRLTETLEAQAMQAAAELRFGKLEELTLLSSQREAAAMEKDLLEAQAKSQQMRDTLARMEAKAQFNAIEDEIKVLDKQRESRLLASREPTYLENPLREDGTLVISDRRIPLNGPIMQSTATFMGERIQFFNNQDTEKPIFIVIDYSPGGSVAAGYQILNAMESSDAPIHVVVKSFAASMAACITTLADESYLLPNARLLHHQMSWGQWGNLSDQRDQMRRSEETWVRLAGPIAEVMGVTLDEFIELMYENSSDGDWMEYSDKAIELKWAKNVAQEIEETALLEHPSRKASDEQSAIFAQRTPAMNSLRAAFDEQPFANLEEQRDKRGEPFVLLPRANPADQFYLYNPDGYYRHHPEEN